MHIGKKIRLARQIQQMTQEDLAEKVNKTRPLISSIERTGKVHPNTLRLILQALDMQEEELENLLTDTPTSQSLQLAEEISQLKNENHLLRQLVKTQEELLELFRQNADLKDFNS
jgi:transcriptional regulator with XRE-family HTH domain